MGNSPRCGHRQGYTGISLDGNKSLDIFRDRELLWKYRKAGIIYISVGIETADQSVLDAIRKEQSLEEMQQVFDLLREQEIVSEASFMVGFPARRLTA